MRCSAWSSLAISACSALVFAAPAAAHVTASPPWLSANGVTTVHLTGPNERDEPVTALEVTVPPGFRIVGAEPFDDWITEATEITATWRGGSLDPNDEATFTLDIEAPAKTGAIELEAVQRYPGGDKVTWPIELTVIPGHVFETEQLGDSMLLVVLVAFVLGLFVAGVTFLLIRLIRRSLQER